MLGLFKHDDKDPELVKRKKFALQAAKWIDGTLAKGDYAILLRTNGLFAGVMYHVEKINVDDDDRMLAYYINSKGEVFQEFLDYKQHVHAKPELCINIIFNKPFILTARRSATMDDVKDSFEWWVTGSDANSLVELKDELTRYKYELRSMDWQTQQAKSANEMNANTVKLQAEKIRGLEAELNNMSRQVMHYEEAFITLEALLKKHQTMSSLYQSAVNELLKVAEEAGVEHVMGVRDKITKILERDDEIMQRITTTAGGYTDLSSKLDLIERKLEDMASKVNETQTPIIIKEEKRKEENAVV